ncbi:alpha/beta fold hydrolase [uncultured Friedmanniella sp.]|uniref:alpha/beta fold hydrolase n=1 Tax=uncultured Friedmanniella sp. TaxID=335381 RepID=UPI0035C966C8
MSEPLVLLPGMGCSADLWADLDLDAEPLTPVLEEPDLDAEVGRLLASLPRRFALAGLSLGAIVAMALVRRAPERVSRLCLMSTNPYGPTPEQLAGWAEQRRTLAAGSARGLQTSLLPLLVQRATLHERVLAMADDTGEARYDAQLRLQATRVDERPGLARISCPTLVIAAGDDRLCPVARHEEIARLVPGAKLVVLPGCAHLSPLEQPVLVSGHLRQWLA